MSIKLYQTETSMFCEKVRIVLRIKNLPYEVVDVRPNRQPLIDFSGQRKVPVMDYDGQCVIDSTFICAFLEEKHRDKSVYPKDPSNKGLALMLEDWADEVLNLAIRNLRRAETPEARQEAEKALAVHFRTLNQFFDSMQTIFGQVTIADIAIFVQLHYLYTAVKYEIPAEYKNLLKWMDIMRRYFKLDSLEAVAA